MFDIFISSVYHALEAVPALKPSELAPFLTILEILLESGLIERFDIDLSSRADMLRDRVRDAAEQAYLGKSKQLFSTADDNRAEPLLLMTDTIEKNAKLLDKRFPAPLLGHVDIVSLVVEVQVPMYLADLEANRKKLYDGSMKEPTPDIPIQDLFMLYKNSKTMLELHEAFCPKFVTRNSMVFLDTDKPIML